MTLYVFPDPRADVLAVLQAHSADFPAGTTFSRKFPTAAGSAPVIQYAWDGTPLQEVNREGCAIRFTVWGWKIQTSPTTSTLSETEMTDLAALVQAIFLDSGANKTWRYVRGTGRLADVDPTTKVPFCTFTLTAETRPSAVA